MLDIREVIHRLREEHSDRRIGREISVDRSILKKIAIWGQHPFPFKESLFLVLLLYGTPEAHLSP